MEIEKIVTEMDKEGMLKNERLLSSSDTFYEITEPYIIKHWDHFSDEFRHIYRSETYEDP